MAESATIQEGFICPVCYIDMHSAQRLIEHSRTEHGDVEIKAKTGGNLRGLLTRAKLKLVNKERQVDAGGAAAVAGPQVIPVEQDTSTVNNVTGIDPLQWDPQRLGYQRDHGGEFRKHRDIRIAEITVEVNKLTIRLEKLMKLVSTESNAKKRKELEKTVVPWKQNAEVPHCRWCAKAFNVRRRRHHCRLCGSIMCKKCSVFLLFSEARLIVYDTGRWDPLSAASSKKRKRVTAEDSDSEEDEREGVRLCETCDELMDRKLKLMSDSIVPPISTLYQKLLDIQREANQLRPQYIEMADALYGGLLTYNLASTQKVYQNLIRNYEALSQLSKRILSLGKKQGEEDPKSLKIQNGVQHYVNQYLQDHMIGLRPLPTPEVLEQIREKRRKDLEERAKLEEIQKKEAQKRALEQQQKSKKPLPKVSYVKDIPGASVEFTSDTQFSPNTWVPASLAGTGQVDDVEDEDPFVIQRRQLITYLEQAREQGKMDEVETLQFSLQQIDAQIEEQQLTFYR